MFGRSLRAYRASAAMEAAGSVGENALFLADVALRFLQAALLLALWRTIGTHGGRVPGFAHERVLTYTLVAQAMAPLLVVRTAVLEDLFSGRVAGRFLRPVPVFGQYAAEFLGNRAIHVALVTVPLFAAAPLLGVDPRPAGGAAAAAFAVSVLFAISVGLAIDLAFGAVMILLDQGWYAIHQLRTAVTGLLSGVLVPLAAYPWELGKVLDWLPFAAVVSAPVRIYVGAGRPWVILATQAAWTVVLWPLAALLWRANRQRLVLYDD